MNKTRSDSLMSQLTEEQQAQVYDWIVRLGYTETLNKVAAPPPEGFERFPHHIRFGPHPNRQWHTHHFGIKFKNRFSGQKTSKYV